MKVLAIETATSICGVAIADENTVLSERWTSEQHIHSEKIVGFVEQALSESDLTLREVDGIAVSIGPGSFTGLRIGLSAAKGLCYASSKPLAAVPTLDAVAHRIVDHCDEGRTVCVVLDAKRDEVYCAWYEKRGQWMEKKSGYQVLGREAFLETLESKASVMLTGEDAERSVEHLKILKGENGVGREIVVAPRELSMASARSVASLGFKMLKEGRTSDLADLEPMYLKEFLIKT